MITYRTISEDNHFVIFDRYTREWQVAEGLPCKIALRQKQYEYYRDLLLNFPQFPSSGRVAGKA